MNRIGPSSVSTTVSIASRVVPGMSCTTARSSPIKPVEERRLADVRATDDRDTGDVGPVLDLLARLDLGKELHELVEQVAGAETVQRRHCEGLAQAERHERPDVAAPRFAVDLVRDQQHRALRSPQPLRDARILFGDADRRVDDEDHRVGLAHGALRLRAHLLVERGPAREPSTRVDDAELGALPLRVERLAVAGDTRELLDDRVAPTRPSGSRASTCRRSVVRRRRRRGGELASCRRSHRARPARRAARRRRSR